MSLEERRQKQEGFSIIISRGIIIVSYLETLNSKNNENVKLRNDGKENKERGRSDGKERGSKRENANNRDVRCKTCTSPTTTLITKQRNGFVFTAYIDDIYPMRSLLKTLRNLLFCSPALNTEITITPLFNFFTIFSVSFWQVRPLNSVNINTGFKKYLSNT